MDLTKYITAPILSSAIIGVYSYYTGDRNIKKSAFDAALNFGAISINEPLTNLLFDTASIARNDKAIESYRQFVRPALASGIYAIAKVKYDNPTYTISEATPKFTNNLAVSFASNMAGTTTERVLKSMF